MIISYDVWTTDFPSHFQIFQPFPANARPPWMFLPRLVEETGHVTEVDVAGNLVYIDIYDVGIEKIVILHIKKDYMKLH